MAFSLDQLTKPVARPIIATIVGEHGLGKTSLAASFPKPVFIRTEDGLTTEHDVESFPIATSTSDVAEQINALGQGEHDFRTLVLDSVSQLNTFIEAEIVAADPKARSINQAGGGYGAGYSAAAEVHRHIRELCGRLSVVKGMNIIFIAHADSETVDPPDSDPYSRYTIRMHKKSVSHYADNVDLVAFLKLKTFATGAGETKKATTTGQRIITCYPTPNHISKNRFDIESDLVYERGTNPFIEYIPYLQQKSEV